MNENKYNVAKKAAVNASADDRFALRLATWIIIGTGLGLVGGVVLSNLVAGIIYGPSVGVLIGSVLEMYRRRTDRAGTELKRPPHSARPLSLRWLLGCLAFLSLSAIFGGVVLVGSPSGAWLRIPLSILHYSPFSDFLIPGLILGLVFGIGSFFAALALWLRPAWPFATALTRLTGEHWAWSAALAIGLGQIIWIVTQILMVRGLDGLQVLYGSLGVLIVVLTLRPGVRRYLAFGQASRSPARSLQ
jgi:hypothetical protein